MDVEDVCREGLDCWFLSGARFEKRERCRDCASERISPAECRATAKAAQEGKVCSRKQPGRSLQQTPLVSPLPTWVIATLKLVNLVDTGDDSSHVCSDLLTGKPFCRPQCEPRAKTIGLAIVRKFG